MGMLNEFKTFAMRGNVIDLAVGVVIGAAFGKIVTALVDGVIMPPIGLAIGGIDFSAITIPLTDEVSIAIGAFLNTLIQFVIIAFAIFLVVKAINRLKKEEPAAPAAPPADVVLLTEIRDLLKQQRAG
jgi:large conductance mechanosensitive channel